ncbi:MAG: rhodanese-like domain-containing protein [Pseudomonadota bacterium]
MIHTGAQHLCDAAMAEVKTIAADEAIAMHESQDNLRFIDVRDVRELWREGTIPGAHHVPRGLLEFWVDPSSPYASAIFTPGCSFIFFCAAGLRSALATKTVQDMGLGPVSHIGGGFAAWKQHGGKVTTVDKPA